MELHKKFHIDEGYCYIMTNYLVLTDHSDPNEILRRKEKDPIKSMKRILFLSFIFYVSLTAYFYFQGMTQNVVILAVFPVFIFFQIIKNRNRSKAKIIPRNKILGINLTKYFFGPALLIHFRDQKGKIKNRYVPMKKSNSEDLANGIKLLAISGFMNLQKGKHMLDSLVKQNITSNTTGSQTKKVAYQNKSSNNYKRNNDGYLKDY